MTGYSLSGILNGASNYAADAGAAINNYYGGSAPGGVLAGAGQTPAGAAIASSGTASASMNSGILQVFVNAVAVVIGIVLIMAALKGDTITNIAVGAGQTLME